MKTHLIRLATLKDEAVGVLMIADYLLYLLNRAGETSYVDALGLSAPTDNIRQLIAKAGLANRFLINKLDVQSGTSTFGSGRFKNL